MRTQINNILLCAICLLVSSCSTLSNTKNTDAGIDGIACVGTISAPKGMNESTNPSLLEQAQKRSGEGGVCAAKVFAITQPVTIYRVFDSRFPQSKYGKWWSLERPQGNKELYRSANAICKEWSNLDRLTTCTLQPGTQVVIGTTQNVSCQDGSTYTKTAENQVFVPNNSKTGIIHTGDCTEDKIWP